MIDPATIIGLNGSQTLIPSASSMVNDYLKPVRERLFAYNLGGALVLPEEEISQELVDAIFKGGFDYCLSALQVEIERE